MPRKKESLISGITIFTASIHLTGILIFTVFWLIRSHPTLDIKHIVLFKADTIEIFINFYFDKITAVFALVGSFLTFLVSIFSRYYLHREEGFKRYFCTILFFFAAYNLVIFAGNFETLFIGWEFVGISSFLLIAFYRDRYLPVKNSMKVISIFRLGDICLILALWMSHHLWHENISFIKLHDLKLVEEHLSQHNWYSVFLALMILLAASAKSGQLPFSSWMPRAMEGPTSSSAIFYGSLSVHLGVLLLLRTYPYWEGLIIIKALIIVVGLLTCIIATGIARVQSTVKTQIAYSSVAQIGLMFIEVTLGLHVLALIHFTGNAFLRSYQLLVSPSVLSYSIHDMVFNFRPKNETEKSTMFTRIKNSFYILSVREWNMDSFLYRNLWMPFKWIGKNLDFLSGKVSAVLLSIIFLSGLYSYFFRENINSDLFQFQTLSLSFLGMLLVFKSFAERGDAIRAWGLIVVGQFFITLSIALLNEKFEHVQIFLYLGGSVVSAIVGFFCLKKIRSADNDIHLNRYHGYTYEYPGTGVIFLLACLGFASLPVTPTFIGMDLLFSHIHKNEILLILFTSVSFLFIEISILRIYSRIFMGQHKKAYHPIAFRNS